MPVCALCHGRIWSRRVETLYFDTLQFLYHLSLVVLVGGGIMLAAAAPAIFRTVRSRGEAGTIFGAILSRYDGLAILSVLLLVATTILKATAFEVTGAPDQRLIARWIALAVLVATTLYASAYAHPVARAIRAQTPAWDDLRDDAPARRAVMARSGRSPRRRRVRLRNEETPPLAEHGTAGGSFTFILSPPGWQG